MRSKKGSTKAKTQKSKMSMVNTNKDHPTGWSLFVAAVLLQQAGNACRLAVSTLMNGGEAAGRFEDTDVSDRRRHERTVISDRKWPFFSFATTDDII